MKDAPTIQDELWAALRWDGGSEAPLPEAREEAVRDLQRRLARIAYPLVPRGVPREDVVQAALLSVLRYARSHPTPPEKLDGFLYFRLRHVVGTFIREPGRGEVSLSEEHANSLFAAIVRPAEGLEQEELQAALRECAERLPPGQRDAWRLRYKEDQSDELAARTLGTGVNASARG